MFRSSSLYITLFFTALLFGSWNHLPLHIKAGEAAYNLSVTTHQIKLDGQVLNYRSTAGYLQINLNGQSSANIFYTAYTLPGNKRPVTFVFNGGPGSASIWLHMGSFGPVRVLFNNDRGDAPATAGYGDNPNTWLGFTDVVFIDPVSTGYSRAEDGSDAGAFNSYQTDINAVGEFIQHYLVQNHREDSPKFLAGESYGAIRAVGLAGYLQDRYKIKLNGLSLISPALNYQLINFHHGNETPYSYYLPSYAIAAQYHCRLSPELQNLSIEQLRNKVTAFAQGAYTRFLAEGDMASITLTRQVIDSLHYYTGLPESYLEQVNGRVTDSQFTKTLLQSAGHVTGTFDSRFIGTDKRSDPSETNLRQPFIKAFNSYIRTGLAYQNNLTYQATTASGSWNYGPDASNSYLDISETLKNLMINNPGLKVNVSAGYYDLATPVGSTEYVIRHLGLNSSLRDHIAIHYYESGHMVYISQKANTQFKIDNEKFYRATLKKS